MQMEDAATAEISRCQIWQWIRHGSVTTDGHKISKEFVAGLLRSHVSELEKSLGASAFASRKYPLAVQLYERMLLADRLDDFLTLVAYPYITTIDQTADAAKQNIKASL